jgi:septum formation protein
MAQLILASASPQRKTLLEGLGVSFDVIPSTVDEQSIGLKDPGKRAVKLAQLKAEDIARTHPHAWVIGCDTLVVAPDGLLLEKPMDDDEARSMITRQSGGVSVVHSGLSLRSPEGKEWSGLSSSSVHFRTMQKKDIDWWVETRLWEGRSGAFQIDGLGQLMIERIDGDWTSIVGLPVYLLGELMRKAKSPFLSQ